MTIRQPTRWRARPGELRSIMRFGVVGAAATLAYLVTSLALLGIDMTPQLANLCAFLFGTGVSYAGHYLFTYRTSASHLRLGSRFLLVTLVLSAMSSALHQVVIWTGAQPRVAAVAVAIAYPLLSLVLNHFWAFSRGVMPGSPTAGSKG